MERGEASHSGAFGTGSYVERFERVSSIHQTGDKSAAHRRHRSHSQGSAAASTRGMLSWNRTNNGSYERKMRPVIPLNCSARIGPQDWGALTIKAGGPPSEIART